MRILLLLGAGLFVSVAQLSAQSSTHSVVNATGSSFQDSRYQVDWSVGELALVEQMSSSNGQLIITNGFLQPQTLALDMKRRFNADEVRVLPNPTYDIVEINLQTAQQGVVNMEVYDANGKVLARRTVQSKGFSLTERIDLRSQAAGTYFLRINLTPAQGFSPKTGSYKIIKLN